MTSPQGHFSYRRYARIVALQALCLAETNRISMLAALNQTLSLFLEPEVQEAVLPNWMLSLPQLKAEVPSWFDPDSGLPAPVPGEFAPAPKLAESESEAATELPEWWPNLTAFARKIAEGVWERKFTLDEFLSQAIPDYDYDRLSLVDRNMLRIAFWEIREVDYIPPAVTINEAIEIVKRFSTAESARFVHGVLGTVIRGTRKEHWNQATAPQDPEFAEMERSIPEPLPPVEEFEVEEGTKEAKTARRYGWVLKSGDREIPANTDSGS